MFSDGVMYTNIVDYTVSGHVVGMLDRDQRTAKLRCNVYHQSAMFSVVHIHNYYCYVRMRNYSINNEKIVYRQHVKHNHSHSTKSRKNSYLWNTLRRLQQALITGIYLLSLVSVPCSLSAPARMGDLTDSSQPHPKWINPCGIDVGSAIHDSNDQLSKMCDLKPLIDIINQVHSAFLKADQFKENFVQQMFNKNFIQHHEDWKSNRYNWLPNASQIPKNLGENLSVEYLQTLKLDDALLDTYHYLQMIAVGLEQIVRDQKRQDGSFLQSFNDSEYYLRLVLCEIQTAIYDRGILDKMHPDVTRDIMPSYLRNETESTNINLRDWIIYREYMNALEYAYQVFNYFKNQL